LLDVLRSGQTLRQDDDVFVRKDGSRMPVAYTSTPLITTGKIVGTVLAFHDITERKRLEAQLAHDALHDPLTGLPNRTLFFDRVGQAVERVARHPEQAFGVLFLDLDRFKAVNDRLGHGRGDQLLKEVSRRLAKAVRVGDTVARLGGDEFAMLLDDLHSVHEITMIAERVQVTLAPPVLLDEQEVEISASIGITLSDAGQTVEALLRDADIAMYRAKQSGRARFEIFNPGMLDEVLARLRLEAELRDAITLDQLVLHYQPIVAMSGDHIVGVEALVRWQHPTRGLLGPNAFIPVAEETGLIVPLGSWVLREACTQATAWQQRGRQPTYVSVNVAAKQLREPMFAAQIQAVLQDTGLPPGLLALEVTETGAMADVALSTEVLHEARALGLHGIAIDDFGTGYSSLNMLQQLPITHVKIDRGFVDDLETNPSNETLARTIIAMGHALGLEVIAEGVETPRQLAILRDQGCDSAQGYLFSRPVPAAGIQTLLEQTLQL
jgi:diguanylate cyclase (GGDEF)-like protein